MSSRAKKAIKILKKQSATELEKWLEKTTDKHEKAFICKGIVNVKKEDEDIFIKAKKFLDDNEIDYSMDPPLISLVYCLCLMGHFDKNKEYLDRFHDLIAHSEGFVALWQADDEYKFGQSSNIGRYTFMLLFDTFEHMCQCADKLVKAGVGEDEIGITNVPMPLKKSMPIYFHNGRFTI